MTVSRTHNALEAGNLIMATQRRSSSGARYYRRGSDSWFRRVLRILISPYLLVPLFLFLTVAAGILIYYYQRYSAIIDAGLQGEIFVRSSGIYAAPEQVRVGGPMKQSDLISYLKRVGYLEKGVSRNEKRGQYTVRGSSVEVSPGTDAIIDNEKHFPALKISFGAQGIQGISDLESGVARNSAELEPIMISSLVNQEREKRKVIEFKDLPKSLIDAITVIEDQQFFEHYGINWRGILRALIRNTEEGRITGGGSSITQQLVKNFFLTKEQTLKRKLSEAYISVLLEQRLSKEQIFAMYCNIAYLGQRAGFSINGFGEAARSYFDKDISQLTVAESAMLAGIIRSPNHYAPFKYPDRAKERRDFVIQTMLDEGKISASEAEHAKQTPLGLKGNGEGRLDVTDAPYFIDYLTRQVERQFDDVNGAAKSLRIYSTIDIALQRAAYQAVTKQMGSLEKRYAKRKGGVAGLQVALVALDAKTGDVLAMVGGKDYAASQFNRATEAKRQPGSVFKPMVYATAIASGEQGGDALTAASMFMDAPKKFTYGFGQEYEPSNFGDVFSNKNITLRDALVFSKNVVTVEVAEKVGYSEISRLAEKAGLPKPPTYPSMALGVTEASPLQVAAAYTMFANQGIRATPNPIKRITSGTGNTIQEVKPVTRQVISPQVAYIMTSMMQDVLARGTGARVRQMGFKATAAGKTGSSRDGWFAGYTPHLVCAIYVGFDDNSDLKMTGGEAAAPIWAEFMMRALSARPELGGEFEDPGGITAVDIDPATGGLAPPGFVSPRKELFLTGTEPGHKNPDQAEEPDPFSNEPPTGDKADPGKRPPAQPGATEPPKKPDSSRSNAMYFDVCEATGLLPVDGICEKTIRKRFLPGEEPTQFCSKAAHRRVRL